jgi:A1 cistron-splicing factor AAR2
MASPPTPTILLLSLPQSCLCGIDLLSFTTSPRFQGIKSLPPGLHFTFTSSTSSSSLRHGVWFLVPPSPSHLIIKKWDTNNEQLTAEDNAVGVLRWKANIGSIWENGLTPYRQSSGETGASETEKGFVEEKQDWEQLVRNITPALLGRITGGEANHWGFTSASSSHVDEDVIPGLSERRTDGQHSERELRFLPIDLRKTWREGAIGRERTEAAKDRSWALDNLIATHCSDAAEMEVIGEMQVCFLMALILGNHSCLEQWKRILELLLTCQAAVTTRPRLFKEVMWTLKLQLQHVGDVEGTGVFDVDGEGGGRVKTLLQTFGRSMKELGKQVKGEVRLQFEDLEVWVKQELSWELGDEYLRKGMLELEDGERVEMEMDDLEAEDERGEYAPVVVDLEGNPIESEFR